MKTLVKSLIAAAIGAATLAAAPVVAADSTEWLQRQFSTDHGAFTATPGSASTAAAPGASAEERSGLDFAAAWLERQFAGEPMRYASGDGVAGRAGLIGEEDSGPAFSDVWLRHQFSANHPDSANSQQPRSF